ncbi:MAG: hypothetical protein MZV63_57475 [Marinilabiliales bacterium]|nr:hypothetical protein [Marinilabiliales bacterium]
MPAYAEALWKRVGPEASRLLPSGRGPYLYARCRRTDYEAFRAPGPRRRAASSAPELRTCPPSCPATSTTGSSSSLAEALTAL